MTVDDAYLDALADEVAERVAARLGVSLDQRPLLTLLEVRQRLGVSERGLTRLLNGDPATGDPPRIRTVMVGRTRRVEAAALDEYLRGLRTAD